MSTLTRPRSFRRAKSRDEARKHPIPPRPSGHGETANLVHSRPRLPDPHTGTTSGQRRVNAKRIARGEFWRTVRIRVSLQAEPYFRQALSLLGNGVRIDGTAQRTDWFAYDFDIHIPGAPANAVTAEPRFRSVRDGDDYRPEVDHIVYWDAAGQLIDTAELAGSAA